MTKEQLRTLRWKERMLHVAMAASVLGFFFTGLSQLS
jgi:hypothetical protein